MLTRDDGVSNEVCVCRKKMELNDKTKRLLEWRVRKKLRMTSRFLLGVVI